VKTLAELMDGPTLCTCGGKGRGGKQNIIYTIAAGYYFAKIYLMTLFNKLHLLFKLMDNETSVKV
jgi:hypothetical protein